MASFDWRPLTEAFGALVTGLDVSRELDESAAAALRMLWRERGLLLFRGIPISDEAQVALTEIFGRPTAHKASETKLDSRPEIIRIAYSPDQREETMIFDLGGEILANWQPWHIDTIYNTEIEHGGILRAIEVPATGADTGFIDRAQLYDRMPDDLRRRAEGRRAIYQLNPIFNESPFNPTPDVRVVNMPSRIARMQQRVASDFPPVSHPVLLRHPETGRMVLNVGTLHALGIEGMPREEGDALLRELIAFSITGGDRYHHKWQRDDIVVWDNWRFLHCAEGTPVAVPRMLYRTGIGGHYREGRLAAPNALEAGGIAR